MLIQVRTCQVRLGEIRSG